MACEQSHSSVYCICKMPLTTGDVEDAGNMTNGHNVMSAASGDACLLKLLYIHTGHVVKIVGT